ncbi:hypothetical protein ISP17_11450 [Dyella ginsengisoli]|uniref:Tip attachment protein J domain-containing protein n=1 Tax=Dyella ginsengisoli TaxID=363848 RepID=A0ABW8JXS1_9GAMM
MGGSKKQTIGYHYKWLLHFGWCRGVIDALLELRGGDAPFFQGRLTSSQRITINKPDLWGGEKGEGGITGDWDILFGEPTQAPNDYLTSVLGAQQSGHRGKFTTVARGGRFGAFTPSPKTVSAKVERILTDWQDDTVWYPEKAVIALGASGATQSLGVLSINANDAAATDVNGHTYGPFAADDVIEIEFADGLPYTAWSRWPADDSPGTGGLPWFCRFEVTDDTGATTDYLSTSYATSAEAFAAAKASSPITLSGSTSYTIWLHDDILENRGGVSFYLSRKPGLRAMNPAHVLYESITRDEMQGEPAGLINDTSFRAAADQLYSEGFGICTTYDSESETPEQFQQRICNLIAGNLTQSRTDGLYYLDLIRAVSDPSALPIITEDDVKTFKQTPWVGSEAVNLIQVEWFDPQAKQVRTTQPVYSAAGIQDVGSPNSDVRTYHEVPVGSLATRLAARELAAASSPLSKIDLTLLPKWRTLRAGTNVRLQLPSEGIADIVLVLGEVAQGTLKDGSIAASAVQNVFSFPDTVFIQQQLGGWVDPAQPVTAPPSQLAFEAPYIELVAALSNADLAALHADAGYLGLLATRPTIGLNYEVDTAAAAEAYQAYGIGDWTASAVINEAAGPIDTSFTFTSATDIDRLVVGGWAIWGDEIVRIDAVDTTAGTLSLGRGCADTVPTSHAAASSLVFAGEWVTGDQREYVGGDVVRAKLLTRSASDVLDISSATELSVTMNDRQVRPYAPGLLRFDDASTTGQAYPAAMVGAITTHWAHRDRLTQADQLLDESAASTGPEAGTTYTVRYYQPPGTLVHTESALTGTAATAYTFAADGVAQISVEANRDGYASWQSASHTFSYTASAGVRVTEAGNRRITEAGAVRTLETP